MDRWEQGNLFDEATAVGPLIDEDQVAWVRELVEDALEKGATPVSSPKSSSAPSPP